MQYYKVRHEYIKIKKKLILNLICNNPKIIYFFLYIFYLLIIKNNRIIMQLECYSKIYKNLKRLKKVLIKVSKLQN